MRMEFRTLAMGILAAAGWAAAGGPPAGGAAKLELGKKIFETNCAACHGPEGKGDGAAAAALNPKPRNFTDRAYMKTRPKATLKKVIAEGGQSVGLSPLMVGWSPSLKPAEIEAVLAYVLTFSAPAKKAHK